MSFVHLHVHTEYSLLDGACRIRDLPNIIKEMGQDACAITDHGVMYGVMDFYHACKKAGIKPIIGCEVYMTPHDRSYSDREYKLDSEIRHLILLCENEEGYRNLSYMVSTAWTDGFYIRPRIDMQLLRAHSKGLIALSACLAGEIPRFLQNGEYENARNFALEMADIFGQDHFYLELQDHGISSQKEVNQGLLRIHQETGLPMVCTNDAHYLRREDAEAHDVLLCIQTGKTLYDDKRLRYEPRNFYLRSEEEMAALFSDYEDAIENTVKIAQMCNLEFTFGQYHLPEFQVPEGYDSFFYLKKLCDDGYQERYGENEQFREQLEYEQNMIEKMGFTDYFLIVSDFVRYAKSKGIPVGPGRGSAAGSIVSYCLRITDIDPIKYNLYFERFLNPERVSMPDIDMDFADTRREEVVQYVREKYGTDHVAQIVTFGTMAARAVVRDVGRVMNIPYAEVDQVAKQIPLNTTSQHITLEKALQISMSFNELYQNDEQIRRLIDTAKSLEGMPRNASTHAAGVVITKRPVYEYVPLAKNDDTVVCQYGMTTLEELGLLKMDFLGLRNLTVLDDALKMLQKTYPDFQLHNIPENDSETFEMIGQGKTIGVFQMESAGMTSICVALKPQNIEDITAIIALYRPGPMESIPKFISYKQNPNLITYQHPLLEPILSVTYGCIVYQEQVIRIFQELGGYSLGQADLVRRAISKKKSEQIEHERNAFIYGDADRNIAGCLAKGIPEETAKAIYQEIYDFGNYAFNKAHAVAYAVVAYQTAYFKCHYPKEYMAALLTSVVDNTEKVVGYINECRECGIPLLPPDINLSQDRFTVEEGGIRFGLVAIKIIGWGFILDVLKERENNGVFESFFDFCDRMSKNNIMNRRAVENLIRAGAFDSTGAYRSQLLKVCGKLIDAAVLNERKNLQGQVDFFSMSKEHNRSEIPLPDIPELTPEEKMMMERETIGLYLSGHPMDAYKHIVKEKRLPFIHDILESFSDEKKPSNFADGQTIEIAGVISSSRTRMTKNNKLMAYVTIEDNTASIELLCFGYVLQNCGAYIKENKVVWVTGRLSVRDEKAPQILCDSIYPISTIDQVSPPKYQNPEILDGNTLFLKFPSLEDPSVRHMKLVFTMFPGGTPVKMRMADTNQLFMSHISLHQALLQEAKETLGEENVIIR